MMTSDEKRLKALKMHKAGKNYTEIAAELEVSESRAYTYVNECWKPLIENIAELQAERTTDQINTIDLLKLNLLPFIINKKISIVSFGKNGGVIQLPDWQALCFATDRLIKVMEYEGRLLGLLKEKPQEDQSRTTIEREVLLFVYEQSRQPREKEAEAKEIAAENIP